MNTTSVDTPEDAEGAEDDNVTSVHPEVVIFGDGRRVGALSGRISQIWWLLFPEIPLKVPKMAMLATIRRSTRMWPPWVALL